jgi:hypothetical protein
LFLELLLEVRPSAKVDGGFGEGDVCLGVGPNFGISSFEEREDCDDLLLIGIERQVALDVQANSSDEGLVLVLISRELGRGSDEGLNSGMGCGRTGHGAWIRGFWW